MYSTTSHNPSSALPGKAQPKVDGDTGASHRPERLSTSSSDGTTFRERTVASSSMQQTANPLQGSECHSDKGDDDAQSILSRKASEEERKLQIAATLAALEGKWSPSDQQGMGVLKEIFTAFRRRLYEASKQNLTLEDKKALLARKLSDFDPEMKERLELTRSRRRAQVGSNGGKDPKRGGLDENWPPYE